MRRVLDIGHVVQTVQAVLFASCFGLYEVRLPLESKYDLVAHHWNLRYEVNALPCRSGKRPSCSQLTYTVTFHMLSAVSQTTAAQTSVDSGIAHTSSLTRMQPC